MLEKITETKNKTSVNLFFKKDAPDRDIFDAIKLSLHNFYWGEFLDELVDRSFDGRVVGKGYSDYRLHTLGFDEKKVIANANKWVHELMGQYSKGDGRSAYNPEQMLLGFVDLFQDSMKWTVRFCIREIKQFGRKFEQDEATSKKHAERYVEFVRYLMRPDKDHFLYIIRLETDEKDFYYIDSATGNSARTLLLRKLKRLKISKGINFPFVYLGSKGIENQESPVSGGFVPNSVDKEKQADWLYDFIENPPEYLVENKLNGITDNSVRTIVYPTQVDYEDVLSLLIKKLNDNRTIIKTELKL